MLYIILYFFYLYYLYLKKKLGATGSIPAGAFFPPKNDLKILKVCILCFSITSLNFNPNILL